MAQFEAIQYAHANRRIIKPEEGRPALELVRYYLFNQKQFAAAGAQQIQFFKNLGAATAQTTNMPNDGFLPSPQVFDVFGVSFFVQQGLNEADLVNFYNNSIAFFRMSEKKYLHVPIHKVPSGGGLAGFCSTTVNNTTIFQATNCLPGPDVALPMDIDGVPLVLVSQQDWFAEIQTFNAVAFTVPFNGTYQLHGVWGRPVL